MPAQCRQVRPARLSIGPVPSRLAQSMGHNSLATTLIYIKSTKADLQQAVEKIAWA